MSNQLVTSSMVQVLNGEIKTTSLQVAEFFGKEHKHVLRDIRELGCSEEFTRSNFGPTDFIDKNGEKQSSFEISRDGFAFLAMGYNGKVATAFKEAYIKAFNTMETALLTRRVNDAIMGKVSERMKLGVWVQRGLSQEQWTMLYDTMRDISGESEDPDKAYNAIYSHFSRHFGDEIPYDLALRYLDMVRAKYRSGYEPTYRGGKLVVDPHS